MDISVGIDFKGCLKMYVRSKYYIVWFISFLFFV